RRYLNGLEEADALLAKLASRLRDPLLIVSADHGQSFGALGYRSHASAVTRDQLLVPLAIHHPKLPARVLEWSTHFDLLPTALDLAGVDCLAAHGQSVLAPREPPLFFVSAGRPSRTATSNFGF